MRIARAGDGRVGAHPAGVRADVAVADALEVLGGRHRDRPLAVAEREQRQLLAGEVLLDEDLAVAEAACTQEVLERAARGVLVLGDDDALAGGQPVVLQDRRVAPADRPRGRRPRSPPSRTRPSARRRPP